MRVLQKIAIVIFVLAVAGHSSASAQRWIEPISPIPDRDTKIDFAPASAALTDEARTILDRQAKILISHPQETAIVYGHADPYEAGSRQGAWDLGLARAVAARAYLVSKGVASNRLRPDSRGCEFVAIISAPTEASLAQMRFVSTEVVQRPGHWSNRGY